MFLHDSLETLPRTKSVTIGKFKLLDIVSYYDLLTYIPSRYENYSLVSSISRLQEGETVTIKGRVEEAKNVYTRNGLKIQKVVITDDTGKIEINWFNQPYLVKTLPTGTLVSVAGTVKRFLHSFSIEPKEYEILRYPDQPTIHTGRIIPIYSEKKGLSSKTIREKMQYALQFLEQDTPEDLEWLPRDILDRHHLLNEKEAYKTVHFPPTLEAVQQARKRLGFDELFTIQLSAALIKQAWTKETVSDAFAVEKYQEKIDAFVKDLPFALTGAQQRVLDDILHDLAKTHPMNRFVQGDVGSGKTVIAAIAAYVSYLNGYQTLYMAPTEILAQQHSATLIKLLEPHKIKVGLQTGSQKALKTEETFDVLVGTHALLTESVKLEKVGLVIIDEQHRFGVKQRAELKNKGINPHLLTMTATPIPRTIALTLYGELDMSVIDEMPKGRLPIKTYLVPQAKRDNGYEWIKKQIRQDGIQAFIICPLVEESDVETMKTIKAATLEYENLKTTVFKDFNVGLLHGKLKPKEKQTIMADFKDKKYDILVATSVVEVGIDVPNATVMIIEGAERYGLAQLHQLRGRVGRGSRQSYCFLFTSSEENKDRLQFFAKTNSGIQLAEYDFKIRGPGNMYGTQQHGYRDLKIATFSDYPLMTETKQAVDYFMQHHIIESEPKMKERVDAYQVNQISRD